MNPTYTSINCVLDVSSFITHKLFSILVIFTQHPSHSSGTVPMNWLAMVRPVTKKGRVLLINHGLTQSPENCLLRSGLLADCSILHHQVRIEEAGSRLFYTTKCPRERKKTNRQDSFTASKTLDVVHANFFIGPIKACQGFLLFVTRPLHHSPPKCTIFSDSDMRISRGAQGYHPIVL